MPERDPHPSAGEHPRSLLRNQGCKTGRGLFCPPSEEAWGLPLWPGPSGHLLRGHFGQRAAGGQLSPWPTLLAARLCLPSAPSPTRSIPEERPMPGTPRGGTASSGPPPPLPGWRPEGMSISAWQGSRTALGISDQGAGLPPRSPDDSGQLLPPCECLAGLWVPGPPPPPRPGLQCLRAVLSGTLDSVCKACTLSPQPQLDTQKRHQRNELHEVLTSSELKVLHAMESARWVSRLLLRVMTMVRTSGTGLRPTVGASHLQVGRLGQR